MSNRLSLCALILLFGSTAGLMDTSVRADTVRQVAHVRLDDQPITPATVRFMKRALREAIERNAECLVLELNTPGGVLQSTQEFVTDILGSPIPVVVYVAPAGGRAASAGVFITLAGHVAAMAPGTRIGAAHPVQIGGLPFSPPKTPMDGGERPKEDDEKPSAAEQKLVNDTVAWAKSLAKLRGRNAEWAARSVSESSVLMASEAVQQSVVDLEATDLHYLLEQLDGREVSVNRSTGSMTVTLKTRNASIHHVEPWWGEQLLGVISNPNVALLLMLFGVYGIMFELYSPGWGVAGTLGVVSLVLGFFGLSVLPVNYAGLALILIALSLFVAEAFVISYGALAVGGIVCLILGGTMLVDSPTGFLHVSLEVLIPIALSTAAIVVFLVSRVVDAQRSQPQMGDAAVIGSDAMAVADFRRSGSNSNFSGLVRMHGEYWQAVSQCEVAVGEHVQIAGREGLKLHVMPDTQPSKDAEEYSQVEEESNNQKHLTETHDSAVIESHT